MSKEANQLLEPHIGYSNPRSQLYIEKVEAKKITADQEILMKLKELDIKASDNLGSDSRIEVEIDELRDHYCTAYLKKTKMDKTAVKVETLTRLIEIEIEMNGNIDEIVSGSWQELRAIDDGKLLGKIQDKFPTPYNKASKLLRHELGDRYNGWTYTKMKSKNHIEYSTYYLILTANLNTCSTSAKLETLMELVEIDLEKGTSIPKIVFNFCKYAPLMKFVKMIMKCGKNQNMDQLVNDVLNYKNDDGFNCLMISTDLIVKYNNINGKDPDDTNEVKRQAGEVIHYLIELGLKHGVDMMNVLNATANGGETLFMIMTFHCYKKVAELLMNTGVLVNSIDQYFQIPSFRIKSVQQLMIDSGANPYIVDYLGKKEFDYCSLSNLKIPEMPKSVYFSIYPDENYPPEMQRAWYYCNGVFPGYYNELIGKGGEGYVVSGKWMGVDAAFKFSEIRDQKISENVVDGLKDLETRLTQINALKAIKGSCIVIQFGHFRQHLYYNDNKELAEFLGLETGQVKHYDVFVTELLDGSLSEKDESSCKNKIEVRLVKKMIQQLIDGLDQLEKSRKSHNDIKPTNVLYSMVDDGIKLKISDFSQCQRSGGTPGWTFPRFQSERLPGKTDMYSMALVILYILCEDANTFYCLRDNFIENGNECWLKKFRSWPEIEMVMKMMSLSDQPTIEECKEQWKEILSNEDFAMITNKRIEFIPENYRNYQFITFDETRELSVKEKAKNEKQYFTQQHDVQMAMKSIGYEGFLRGPGLLQLETIKKFFSIINQEPKFEVHMKKVTDFCEEGNEHWPTVILYGIKNYTSTVSRIFSIGCKKADYATIPHAAVMIGYANQDSSLKLTIRNSLAGQKVFGKIEQPSEHEIDGKITNKINEWNLAQENCHYIEFS